MGHSVLPRPCQGAIGCEKMVARQLPSVQRPPVQSNCCNDSGRQVGVGFGRRSSISCRISANSRRGIATSASWKVTYRPCRTTLAPIFTSFSRSVVSDQCSTSVGDANFRLWLLADSICCGVECPLVTQSGPDYPGLFGTR